MKAAKGVYTHYEDSESINIIATCECGSPEHSLTCWLEVEDGNVVMTTFIETNINYTPSFKERLKVVWGVLTKGYYKQEHEIIMDAQTVDNFVETLQSKLKEIKK